MREILLLFVISSSFYGMGQFTERSSSKDDFGIRIGLPQVNALLLYNQENLESKIGFNGISGGFYYFYKKNNFFEFTTSLCATSNIPVPGPVTYAGKYEIGSALVFNFSHNHMSEMFNFGYGISIINYKFVDAYRSVDNDTSKSFNHTTSSINLGLHLTGQLLLGKRFALSLNYNPTLFRLNSVETFAYQHQIGLEFLWRLKLNRK